MPDLGPELSRIPRRPQRLRWMRWPFQYHSHLSIYMSLALLHVTSATRTRRTDLIGERIEFFARQFTHRGAFPAACFTALLTTVFELSRGSPLM